VGKLFISYDCEGIWGMLDDLERLDESVFKRESLLALYSEIVRLHEEFALAATFAFVGAFVTPRAEFLALRTKYSNARAVNDWCGKLESPECKFTARDVHIPELLEKVQASSVRHEVASHGFSHVIMSGDLDRSSIEFELEGLRKFSDQNDTHTSTIVFPRNVVNHEFLSRATNIVGFRAPPRQISTRIWMQRGYSLLKEFWPFCRSENVTQSGGKIAIPGDFFINWRRGARRLVPVSLTLWRFRSALEHACRNDGIVHIWLHPHNLLTGRNQLKLLKEMLAVANEYKCKNGLRVLTQREFIVGGNQS